MPQIIETIPEYTVYDSANSDSQWNCTDGAVAGSVCVINLGQVYPTMMGMDSTRVVQFAVRVIENLPP